MRKRKLVVLKPTFVKNGSYRMFDPEFKLRVAKAYKKGIAASLIGVEGGISVSQVYNWAKRYEELGEKAFLPRASKEFLSPEQKALLDAIGKGFQVA